MRPHRLPKLGAPVRPATLLKLHGALVERKYRRLFSSSPSPRRKPGPKGPSRELIAAIIALKGRNPHFGCVRIAQQITRAFGVEIDKDVVRRVLAKHHWPGDPGATDSSWLTFIAHAKDSLWSVDLFRCESILLQIHWVLVVIDVFTRRIIGFGIERASIDGVSVCRMFNHAVAGRPPPKHVSTDHDPPFRCHRWRANLRVREIEEVKSVPYAPVSHPFVERLIGTIRREYLDRVFFWNAVDLARKLEAFRDYYNDHRVHRALAGLTPAQFAGALSPAPAALDHYGWQQHCRGLFKSRSPPDYEFATDSTTPAQRAGASSPIPASLARHAWRQHCGGLFQTPMAA